MVEIKQPTVVEINSNWCSNAAQDNEQWEAQHCPSPSFQSPHSYISDAPNLNVDTDEVVCSFTDQYVKFGIPDEEL